MPDDGEARSAVAELVAAAADRRLGCRTHAPVRDGLGRVPIYLRSCAAGRPTWRSGTHLAKEPSRGATPSPPGAATPCPATTSRKWRSGTAWARSCSHSASTGGTGATSDCPPARMSTSPERARTALAERWDDWLAAGLIPTEPFPLDTNDQRPNIYGMDRWHKLFTPRQLLAMLTYLEALREMVPEMERELGKGRAAAVRTYLGIVHRTSWLNYQLQPIDMGERPVTIDQTEHIPTA